MWGTLGALALLPALVRSYASTDSIMDADLAQSGYLSNHPMDPNVVGGSSFGILWKQQMTDSKEQWFAKPLVYTQNGGSEMLITASNENNVRIHDAKTGTLITSRTLHPPFLQSDIGCNDVPDYIGVMGTPIIDPATDIIYMFAKGYKNGAASGGVANGEYKLHALQLPALTDAPGFPVIIDGHRADNDPAKYFIGGTIMQRPALTSLNGVIVGAFGGHCDLFNFTGMIVSVSKTPNVGVVSIYAMEQAPGAPSPNPTDITSEKGGKAGIWQSGMGLATDGNRIFVTTGNGQGHANGDVPASGRLPLTTLDECIANFAVSSTGVFSLTDYFEPYDYVQMDAQDKDLGSSGTALLDATTFRTSTINRMAVTVGKNGKVYITNADNLGGFKQGSGGTDNIIQTITAGNSVFGGAGSYPLEGGYIYFTPVGLPTYAYKFGTDSSGAPFFTLAGKTATNSAGRAGVGQPTVTSYNGIAGTGILWVTDVNSGLLAFKAVPNSAGVLEAITLPATPGINKYQRPVFGSGKVFVTASNKIYCLGYPVNLPLNCTTPVDFGSVQTGDTKTATISCKANIAITKVKGCVTSDALFQCSNSSLPQGALAAGATFTFPVTWNLTEKSIEDAEGTSYAKVLPGVESGVLSLITTNGVTGYTDTTPLSLTGTVVSADPYLWMNPSEVDFGGLVLGSDDAAAGLTGSASIANIGSRALTFTGMAWQLGTDTTGEWHNLTFTDEGAVFGLGFTSSSFPKPGSQLAAGETIAVPLLFNSTTIGTYSLNLMLWSDGGQDSILLAASVGNPPIATIAVSTLEGGWDYSEPTHMAFGNVLAGQTVIKKIQICNVGGSVLTITKSKPPSSAQLTAVSPYGELLEGQKIDVGACANGSVAVYAAPIQLNHPSQYISLVWVLNTDGLSNLDRSQPFGVHEVQTDVTIVSAQIGPLLANGTARYQWVGCFADTNGRNLQTQINTAAQQTTNSNDQCQTLCMNAGYAIAGTEYSKECWCGNAIKQPSSLTPDSANHCTFSCTGNNTQSCGGDGGYLSMYADITKFDIAAFLAGTSSSTTKTTTTMLATGTATGSTTTTTAATSTSTGSPLNPNEPAVVNGQWNYIGCYKDNVNNVRSLSTKNTAADTMTLESCATYCSAYNFFGTEYGRECYCGYTLDTTLRATESDCSTKCAANSAELCGAGSRLAGTGGG
ncbi:putative wsc domain-containing protein [Phaeoacremonium minimum UCRPA7]|uniref:Putative wsc domain-containing protein n=1 Tax=Phaeoacremonium minimum (strain UCR-PA7) TaxID=1286976 RepID=R8BN75_PHAM7|nr:putative wsc domain-containing protein [Phaeoacremonium minimum UCRPA7]EOO00796.1 putative wsc domain-containing protein [Phaeoacremonium minimum UCRPA7]